MTGFGRAESKIEPFGLVSIEIRSINHKFLETIVHAPEGFLSVEEKIKKEVESKIPRGRITAVMNVIDGSARDVAINEQLIKRYLASIKKISSKFRVQGEVNINNLINLPVVLSLTENRSSVLHMWPQLKSLTDKALLGLISGRQKEGKAIAQFLKERNDELKKDIEEIKARFKKVMKEKGARFATDSERSAFIKESDINEEIERLDFHILSFKSKLSVAGPMGKELDFISQEMQREANTMGAKTCDATISGTVVRIKSHIEKTREQLQNIV
jgi:uncharacterized protein (TIGR00255 family)